MPAADVPPPPFASVRGLVILCGAAGSGKSTWAAAWAPSTAIVSSDALRAAVADDPADQGASADAFHLLHELLHRRLRRGRTTVADTTALEAVHRTRLRDIARFYQQPASLVLFPSPLPVLHARITGRARQVPYDVVAAHALAFDLARARVPHEGYDAIWTVTPPP